MMKFNDLDPRSARENVNLAQIWEPWIEAEDLRRHSYLGTMGYQRRNDTEYLYRKIGKVAKSLGARGPETEAILLGFKDGRERNARRLASLGQEMDREAAILRGLGAGRVPQVAARILREIRISGRDASLRVVGTNALYAYEVLAGVVFEEGATATGDIDLLQDDRKKLKLITDEREAVGLAHIIHERVDRTFAKRGPRDFRLTNDDGYMVELIRPQPRPSHRRMRGQDPIHEDDLYGAPIEGLQWLVHVPSVEALAVDERGYPVPMTCPDPRVWVAHKLWLADRENRSAIKKHRDRGQAEVMIRLLGARLQQFAFDARFMDSVPQALRPGLIRALEEADAPGAPTGNRPAW